MARVPIVGFTNHTDKSGLQRAPHSGFRPGDRQVGARGARARDRGRADRASRLTPRARLAAVTYIIAEPCIDIKDRSCVDVCPVDCIHEFDRMLIIDPEECIDCGACEPECPVEAIFPEDALPDKWEPFVRSTTPTAGAEAVNPLANAYATEHNVQNPPLDSA